MMFPIDTLLDIFQFLDRNELEKCQLINLNFKETIANFGGKLPLRILDVLENDSTGSIKIHNELAKPKSYAPKNCDGLDQEELMRNMLAFAYIRKIHIFLAEKGVYEMWRMVVDILGHQMVAEVCEIYCKKSDTSDFEKLLIYFNELFKVPKLTLILRSHQINFILENPEILPKPPIVLNFIIRENKSSKQILIEFRELAKFITGQLDTSNKNSFEILLFDAYCPFIVNIAKRFVASKTPENAFKTISFKLDHSFESFLHIRYLQGFMQPIPGVEQDPVFDLEKDHKEVYYVNHPDGYKMKIQFDGMVNATDDNFWCIVPGIMSWTSGGLDQDSDEERPIIRAIVDRDEGEEENEGNEAENEEEDNGVVEFEDLFLDQQPGPSNQRDSQDGGRSSRWQKTKNFFKQKFKK